MQRGKIIIVVGPTGSGKGTLISHALAHYDKLQTSISCTTRAPRPGEADGVEYHFITRDEFEKRIAEDGFLEWAEYGGNYYGTPRKGIEERLERGISVILEIEVQGARIVKSNTVNEDRFIVFIDAGSWETLEARVRARAPMTDEELAKRRQRYEDELSFKSEADAVVENQDGALEAAKQTFVEVITSAIAA